MVGGFMGLTINKLLFVLINQLVRIFLTDTQPILQVDQPHDNHPTPPVPLCIDEHTEPFPTVVEVPAREASFQGIRIGLYEVTYATS